MAGYGTFPLNMIQLGRESAAGTAVAATSIWRGPATDIVDESTHQFTEEDVGILVPTDREYISKLYATLAMPETEATFEQILHILEAGIQTATPAGTQAPYTYTYAFPLTSTLNTVKTYTIETGNVVGGDVNEMQYAFVTDFSLSGAAGEAWKVSANWAGRQKSTTTFTDSLSLTAQEEMLFNKTTLYIDASAGTVGTTPKAGVLTAASVEVTTGIVPVWTADGQLYFYKHKFTRPTVAYSLTLELESDTGVAAAERAAWVAKTLRLIQLKVVGATTSELKINIAGKHMSFGEYNNSDGNTVIEISGEAKYSSVDALFASFIVKSTLATVP